MLERLRTQIGTAGLVVAIVALVAALGGGAYAATGGGSGHATASAKAKQGKQGKPGKPGKTGPAGPAGATGPAGAPGAKGDAGAAGAAGAAGTSVTNTSLNPGEGGCTEGGAQFTVGAGAPTHACNGEEGPQGPAGPSCNASGECLLPAGAIETGVWSLRSAGQQTYLVSISFPLRLISPPQFIYVGPAQSDTPGAVNGCPGTVTDPQAAAGNFCLYAGEAFNVEEVVEGVESADSDLTSGETLTVDALQIAPTTTAFGSWAVKR